MLYLFKLCPILSAQKLLHILLPVCTLSPTVNSDIVTGAQFPSFTFAEAGKQLFLIPHLQQEIETALSHLHVLPSVLAEHLFTGSLCNNLSNCVGTLCNSD